MPEIKLVVKDPEEGPCLYCDKAKALLGEHGLAYELEVKDAFQRNDMYIELGLPKIDRTVPQIWWDGERIKGGYQGLRKKVLG